MKLLWWLRDEGRTRPRDEATTDGQHQHAPGEDDRGPDRGDRRRRREGRRAGDQDDPEPAGERREEVLKRKWGRGGVRHLGPGRPQPAPRSRAKEESHEYPRSDRLP